MKLVSIVGLLASVLAVGGAVFYLLVGFGFQGESMRGAATPAKQNVLQMLSIIVVLLPLVHAGVVAFRWSAQGRTPSVLECFLPLLSVVVCSGAAVGLFVLGEAVGAPELKARREAGEKEVERKRTELRAQVAAGKASACQLLATDPAATLEDLRACRANVEKCHDAKSRWAEIGVLIDGSFGRLSLPAVQNENLSLDIPDQTWILSTLFKTWLEKTDVIAGPDEILQFSGLCESFGRFSTDTLRTIHKNFGVTLVDRFKKEVEKNEKGDDWHRKQIALNLRELEYHARRADILDLMTKRAEPELKKAQWKLLEKDYGSGLNDVRAKFQNNKGEIVTFDVWYWYPDNSSHDTAPELQVNFRDSQDNMMGPPSKTIELRRTASDAEVEKAADELIAFVLGH